MFRNRRFACLFLGMWLGAAVSVDVLAMQNLSVVDSFISAPGSPSLAVRIKQVGQTAARFILRRNADEENARIFEIWEWIQIGIAIVFFFLILFGERPPISALALVVVMLMIVLLERFLVTPHFTSLGIAVDEIPADGLYKNPIVDQFHAFQGAYAGCEILKLLLGLGTGARLMIRRTSDHSREQDREMAAVGESVHRSHPERRVRKRRKTDQNG